MVLHRRCRHDEATCFHASKILCILAREIREQVVASEPVVKVIAEKRGPAYIVWEGIDSQGLMDEVVIIRPASNEGYRYMLGSLLACGFWREPSADAPSAEELVARLPIVDYMWLAKGKQDRPSSD